MILFVVCSIVTCTASMAIVSRLFLLKTEHEPEGIKLVQET